MRASIPSERMSASGSSSSEIPLAMIDQRKIASADKGCHVVCVEFKQARHPLKWRKYMCARCGALHSEHRAGKIREEHLPPRKRLLLRYKREQKALATVAASARQKDRESREKEEGEVLWSPGATTTKGKRAPRRRRA